VDGRPLDRYCREAALLGLRERVDLLARVADAVHSLHEHGVIHRDLKPANILVDAAGIPFLLDLGIAALLENGLAAAATLSPDGAPIGTPAADEDSPAPAMTARLNSTPSAAPRPCPSFPT
jgi:serine/threonine protein kinase